MLDFPHLGFIIRKGKVFEEISPMPIIIGRARSFLKHSRKLLSPRKLSGSKNLLEFAFIFNSKFSLI